MYHARQISISLAVGLLARSVEKNIRQPFARGLLQSITWLLLGASLLSTFCAGSTSPCSPSCEAPAICVVRGTNRSRCGCNQDSHCSPNHKCINKQCIRLSLRSSERQAVDASPLPSESPVIVPGNGNVNRSSTEGGPKKSKMPSTPQTYESSVKLGVLGGIFGLSAVAAIFCATGCVRARKRRHALEQLQVEIQRVELERNAERENTERQRPERQALGDFEEAL